MITYFNKATVTDNEPHWACGKVECDCDEQTQYWLDEENL